MYKLRLLIFRVSAIGDVIHTLPALLLLRTCLPTAHITWVVQRKAAGLLQGHSLIDELSILPDNFLYPRHWRATYHVMQQLSHQRWDVILDFQGIEKTSVLLSMLCGKKYGFGPDQVRCWPTALMTDRWVEQNACHIIQKNMALASAVVHDLALQPQQPTLAVLLRKRTELILPTAAEVVEQWLVNEGIGHFLVLAPNTTWVSKRWPLRHWQELCHQLIAARSADASFPAVVLVGKTFDADAAALAAFIERERLPISCAPAWQLSEVAALLARATCVIAPDTGLLHLADFLGIPAVGIFGPTNKDKHGPFLTAVNRKATIQVPCPHVYQKNHGTDGFDCMAQLSPSDVVSRIIIILKAC